MLSRVLLAGLLAVSAACTPTAPPCPFTGPADVAPSAGCLAVVHGQMLAVEGWQGRVSPPGGHVRAGESAQCAAHRETWEETGLDLLPRQLVHTFDTGFKLYRCEIRAGSGELDPQDRGEVTRAFWLPLGDFERREWRFPQQGRELLELIQSSEPAAASR